MPNHSRETLARDARGSTIASAVSALAPSRSGMCVVASTTRSLSEASIIATREPVSAASISVWPGKS